MPKLCWTVLAALLLAWSLLSWPAGPALAQDAPPADQPAPQDQPEKKEPKEKKSKLAARPASAPVTDEEIQAAIERGVASVLAKQNDQGFWSEAGRTWEFNHNFFGGQEVCAMLALAYGGVSLNDPKMQKGFDALLEIKMGHTYTCAIRIMVIAKLWPKLDREKAEKARAVMLSDVRFLCETQHDNGGWGYPAYDDEKNLTVLPKPKKGDAWWDFSNTQMAILGLSEAIRVGVEVPLETMKRSQDLYLKMVQADGGWDYGHELSGQPGRNSSYGSMTAAGVASLFITRDYLFPGLGCPCRGDKSAGRVAKVDQSIEGGLAWLGKYFLPTGHPMATGEKTVDRWLLYWLYACERAGLASGIKYFAGHDWYAEGARHIVRKQSREGDWGKLPETAYAICFLVKGRAPILFNKLQFKGEWNNHPRDMANLIRHVEKQKEQPLQWQVVNLSVPVAELHDAPILYITAESKLDFSAEEKQKLRDFTDSGGTILFEASCGSREASTAWRAICKEIWPEFELQKLDKEHPLYGCDVKMKSEVPLLYGMDDGLRTFMIVSWLDISCAWNTQAVTKQKALFEIGSNFFIYTTDHRALKARLAENRAEARKNYESAQLSPGARPALKVARLKHGGDWYIGRNYHLWPLLAENLAEACPALKVEAATEGQGLDAADLATSGTQVAHLVGRKAVSLNEAELAALKQYLAAGQGLLLAESALGDARFDAQLRTLAKQLGLAMRPLEAGDPFLAGQLGRSGPAAQAGQPGAASQPGQARGFAISDVGFKHTLKLERVGKNVPELYGLELGGRLVGLYSPFDLTYSQSGYDAYGNRGYAETDARAILANFLLLATATTEAAPAAPAVPAPTASAPAEATPATAAPAAQ